MSLEGEEGQGRKPAAALAQKQVRRGVVTDLQDQGAALAR
jgi:hypothetical protein